MEFTENKAGHILNLMHEIYKVFFTENEKGKNNISKILRKVLTAESSNTKTMKFLYSWTKSNHNLAPLK